MDCAQSRSSLVTFDPPAIALAPLPTSTGVLGIERMTAAGPGKTASRRAVDIPATTESIRVTPEAPTARAAFSAWSGLTLSTAPVFASTSWGSIAAMTETPGSRASKTARCSGKLSMRASSLAWHHFAFKSPSAKAEPMRPPPTMMRVKATSQRYKVAQRAFRRRYIEPSPIDIAVGKISST